MEMEKSTMLLLALDVPSELLDVSTGDDRVVTLLDAALAELDRRVQWSSRLALGPLARADVPDLPFDASAVQLLQAARRELHSLSATHAAVGRTFAVARARVGADRHPDLVDACEARRHDGFFLAKLSMDKLLAAAGYAEAAAEAFDVARGVSYLSPLWRGWTTAAEDLARAAHKEASDALAALLGMQREINLEFFRSWALLKAIERDRWWSKAREVPATIYRLATFVPLPVAVDKQHEKPADLTAAALANLTRLLRQHEDAGDVLVSAASHLSLPRGDLWNRWSTRHGEVASAGKEAAHSLKSALDTIKEIENADKPPMHLLRRAPELIRSGRQDLRRMRTAATLEVLDAAWLTLKRASD